MAEYVACEKRSGTWHTHCGKCKEADDLQRREYAKAALTGLLANQSFESDVRAARVSSEDAASHWAWELADRMLTEQHKREGGQ